MPFSKPSKTKVTKDGKMSFHLPDDLKQLIIDVIECRLRIDHTVEEYLFHLLNEAKNSLRKDGRIKMRKSEFFAVFHPDQMRHMKSDTQHLVRAHLGDLESPTLLSEF